MIGNSYKQMRADEISANIIVALDGLGDFTSIITAVLQGRGISIYLVQKKMYKIIIFKVVSPRAGSDPELWVADLIDFDDCCRKLEVLENLFLPFEVDIIRSIPLSGRWPSDKLMWSGTQNGFFFVQSAYKYVLEFSSISLIGSTSDDRLKIRLKCKYESTLLYIFYAHHMQLL